MPIKADENREEWLRSEVAARDAELKDDPSIGVPIEEAFGKMTTTGPHRFKGLGGLGPVPPTEED